jgi:hypothetical protein
MPYDSVARKEIRFLSGNGSGDGTATQRFRGNVGVDVVVPILRFAVLLDDQAGAPAAGTREKRTIENVPGSQAGKRQAPAWTGFSIG